jgi:hypothetical protein
MSADIDITFDFRRDTPDGQDPDKYSKTLRRYHKLLWSKRLPRGEFFGLDDTTPGCYLHHKSTVGEFCLASDTVIPTFRWNAEIRRMISAAELAAFNTVGYTIGGMMVFPGRQIDGKWTINQARGCTRQVGDRFDLTLECIRRYYNKDDSPLSDVLTRYSAFFDLFQDFLGYVDFFLLQDLVVADGAAVKIASPFNDFRGTPIPASIDEYRSYKNAAIAFVEARNQRILHSL